MFLYIYIYTLTGHFIRYTLRVKQNLRIAQHYANEQRILRTITNMSEESVSGAHTVTSFKCTQDRTDFRSDPTVLNDLTVAT